MLVSQILKSKSDDAVVTSPPDMLISEAAQILSEKRIGTLVISSDGKSVVLYVWYDNEYGYTRQVIRLAKYIARVRRPVYY